MFPLIINTPIIFRSKSTSIYVNLAFENLLYQHSQISQPLMFLWQNDKNIVIGRHQNPWKECHLEQMKQDNVNLCRRKSGGGAVYQDLGNHCFTFINPINNTQIDPKTINNDLLLSALKQFKIDPILAGRNDIHLNGKKISGSAYQLSLQSRDNPYRLALHHGTMLLSCNFSDVNKYLNPSKKKLISKGVDSVLQRIMNLNQVIPHINREIWEEKLIEQFKIKYNGDYQINIVDLDEESMICDDKFKEIYDQLISWEWLYQYTPEFSNNIEEKFTWGMVDVYFEVRNGKVVKGRVHSDSLYPEFIECLDYELNNGDMRYDFSGVRQWCGRVRQSIDGNQEYVQYLCEFEEWLLKSI